MKGSVLSVLSAHSFLLDTYRKVINAVNRSGMTPQQECNLESSTERSGGGGISGDGRDGRTEVNGRLKNEVVRDIAQRYGLRIANVRVVRGGTLPEIAAGKFVRAGLEELFARLSVE